MSNNLLGSTLTAGFIDLATYDELEKYLYGGTTATTYFFRMVRKSTWFTVVPTVLSKNNTLEFGVQNAQVNITRAGDFLLNCWLRVTLPQIVPKAGVSIRWTKNVGHNLIQQVSNTFNDLTAASLYNYYMDFWAAFTVPASKRTGYNNMIGNVRALTDAAVGGGALQKTKKFLPSYTLNVPLPFWFTLDTGVSLPTAALPYNDMKIAFNLQTAENLLVVYENGSNTGRSFVIGDAVTTVDGSTPYTPTIANQANVWAMYAIVSNDERKRMGCAARDILVEQQQLVSTIGNFNIQSGSNRVDIRFSHSVKVLYFAVRNTTIRSEWSNYVLGNVDSHGLIQHLNIDPVHDATLLYENTARLAALPADYFSLVEPWFKAPTIPEETGYHMYSYTLDITSLDPMGSTNFGKLTNISLDMSGVLTGKTTVPEAIKNNTYSMIVCGTNHNVVRISGGALGFPVL